MSETWSQWESHVIEGEFRLQKFLGGSSQSAVFLAEYQGHEPRQVAIRLARDKSASAELQLKRWGIAQNLSHPHLIRLQQTGRCRLGPDELIFAVMEYAEENLGQILPERPLTEQEAREMLQPTLAGLAFLHSQGLVHGGLSPSGVMAIHDQLKLCSDGICQSGEPFPRLQDHGPYDPPEKSDGKASPASDVWSLGMTLTEVLTQRPPTWMEPAQADPVLPEELPEPFSNIVRGCLRRDPRLRLTLDEIAALLQIRIQPCPAPAPELRVHPAPAPPSTPSPVRPSAAKSFGSGQKSSKFRLIFFVAVLITALTILGRILLPSAGRRDALPASERQNAQTEKTGDSTTAATGQQPVIELHRTTPTSRIKPSPGSPGSPRSSASAPQINRAATGAEVIHQALPEVPQTSLDTIQGTVRVSIKVQVDQAGNVVKSDIDSAGPSPYFARLAMQAAQGWKFAPSAQDDQRQFVLRFEFRNTGIKASAMQASR